MVICNYAMELDETDCENMRLSMFQKENNGILQIDTSNTFTPCKDEQPLRYIELQEKEVQKE